MFNPHPHMPIISRIIASAGLIAAFTATASAKIERVVEKTFEVQQGVHIKVATSGGDIHVLSTTGSEVKIVAKEHIRADSDEEADAILKKLNLDISQSGSEVEATAAYEKSMGFHVGNWPPVQVEFYVTVPTSSSAELKTSGGDVDVGDLDGSVHVRTSGGNIKLARIGGEIDAETSGGNVTLDEGRSNTRLSTSGGNISADKIVGPADLETSGGDIKVDSVMNTLSAHTSGGDVKAGFDNALKGDCTLSTSGGEVRAVIGKDVGFHIDASTSGGEVDVSGLTITIEHGRIGRSSISGQINGGGPDLKLRSSGGDIKITGR
jgi:DUF4097 and DUF4098 domain-containing protein YvlB